MTEVSSYLLSTQPYACIGMVIVEWQDGSESRGTCTLVGRNDILTAGHVIYDPSRGGWGKSFSFYFGADYNARSGVFEVLGVQPNYRQWRALAWPEQTFANSNHDTMVLEETQFDVALIGIDVPLGDTLGWMGLDPGQNRTLGVQAVGYPAGSTGMMEEYVTVSTSSSAGAYVSPYSVMGPGSSGGPLLNGDYVIGVKSTGIWWADIGNSFIYDELLENMASNDELLGATGGDFVAPRAVFFSPSQGDTGVAQGGSFVIEFDESIRPGAGNVVLRGPGGGIVEVWEQGSSRLSVTGKALLIDPARTLDVFTRYSIDIGAGAVEDASGNRFEGVSYGFQTRGPESLYHFFLVAFDAAPGVEYMEQMALAYNQGADVRQIVNVFTTKPQFTSVYPAWLSNEQLADKLVASIVGSSASTAARTQAVRDIDEALDKGWSRGDVVYQVFGNLAAKPLTDVTWGNTARQFQNQAAVARYFTEEMLYQSTDLGLLRAVVAGVDDLSDASTPQSIANLIGVALEAYL